MSCVPSILLPGASTIPCNDELATIFPVLAFLARWLKCCCTTSSLLTTHVSAQYLRPRHWIHSARTMEHSELSLTYANTPVDIDLTINSHRTAAFQGVPSVQVMQQLGKMFQQICWDLAMNQAPDLCGITSCLASRRTQWQLLPKHLKKKATNQLLVSWTPKFVMDNGDLMRLVVVDYWPLVDLHLCVGHHGSSMAMVGLWPWLMNWLMDHWLVNQVLIGRLNHPTLFALSWSVSNQCLVDEWLI